ncbi:MAG: cobyrinic acid a,c-diamide synthase [Pseudonocardiales bacterium]
MSKRASLPGAAELFRTTSVAAEPEPPPPPAHPGVGAVPPAIPEATEREEPSRRANLSAAPVAPAARAPVRNRRIRAVSDRGPSGRERHDEKITVYCSPDELLDLESARLTLRAEHGLAIDRGRIVREAVAVVLADLEAKGEASILVRRLREL